MATQRHRPKKSAPAPTMPRPADLFNEMILLPMWGIDKAGGNLALRGYMAKAVPADVAAKLSSVEGTLLEEKDLAPFLNGWGNAEMTKRQQLMEIVGNAPAPEKSNDA